MIYNDEDNNQYVVVHAGRRDHYQVALALIEKKRLANLFTDLYCPDYITNFEKKFKLRKITSRQHSSIASKYTTNNIDLFFGDLLARRTKNDVEKRLRYIRLEKRLSERAANYVLHHNLNVLTYSYYWHSFPSLKEHTTWSGRWIVFQVHPITQQVRNILSVDRDLTGLKYCPEREEIENPSIVNKYVRSIKKADGIIATSSFTAKGLIDAGVSPEKIKVIPYGAQVQDIKVDFSSPNSKWEHFPPLKLLWVGQLAYRKGAHHLFNALRIFPKEKVQLSLVTRSRIPQELKALKPENVQIHLDLSDKEVAEMYRSHHLFVLPSLVEGFGLVYLEALAQGLPILGTFNTGVPDIIQDYKEGFIVSAGSTEDLVNIIGTCVKDPSILQNMELEIRKKVNILDWRYFRSNVTRAIKEFEKD